MFFLHSLSKALVVLPQNICAYLQNELEKFNDIYEENTVVKLHTDPAFVAYIKGEETEAGMHCSHTTSENVKSRRFEVKEMIPEKNNRKRHKLKENTSTSSKKRNKCGNKTNLRMSPPPVEELEFRKESVIRTEKVNPSSTQVSRRVSSVERRFAAEHTSHDCCENFTPDSTSKDSKTAAMKTLPVNSKFAEISKYLQFLCIVNVVMNGLVRLGQKLFAYIQLELEMFNNIYGQHTADTTEPAFIAYLKGENSAPYIFCPHLTFKVRAVTASIERLDNTVI